MSKRLLNLVTVLVVGHFSLLGFAGDKKTLIEIVDGKPVPAMAKSWNKIKNGEIEFTIDTSIELTNGKALTTDAVKGSVEKKLSVSHGAKVNPTTPDKLTISFTGDEKEFLDKLAQVKIRAISTDVADSSGSDGGIRARRAGLILAEGEIRGFVLKVYKQHCTFRIIETNSSEFKVGDTIDMKFAANIPVKKNLNLFFVPEKGEDGFWRPKADTITQ